MLKSFCFLNFFINLKGMLEKDKCKHSMDLSNKTQSVKRVEEDKQVIEQNYYGKLLNIFYTPCEAQIEDYQEVVLIKTIDFYKKPAVITLYKNKPNLPFKYNFDKQIFGVTMLYTDKERDLSFCVNLEIWFSL
jgi:hypothetical protein